MAPPEPAQSKHSCGLARCPGNRGRLNFFLARQGAPGNSVNFHVLRHVKVGIKAASKQCCAHASAALLRELYTCITSAVPASSILPTSSSAVLHLLRQSLDRGRWSPGAPLRQEEIAAELGVSRVPVREAFFQLQAEGLVQVVPNRGVYVRTMSADNLRELFRLRQLLEGDLLVDALPLHTATTINRLETVQAALDKAGTVADWIAGDREFHEALYAPAERPETMAIVRRLRHAVDRFYFARLKPSTRAQGWHEEHHALIRAVRRGDATAAARQLAAHLDETERSALLALPKA